LSLGESNSGSRFPVPGVLLALLVALKQEGDLSESDSSILFPSPGHMSAKGNVELLISAKWSWLKVEPVASQNGL
jgi:hypothetical protein